MEDYLFVKDIGAGSFGLAKLMRHKATEELVAMKFIERGPKIQENVAGEIISHRSLAHPNIIRFKEVLLSPTHLVIVMEYAAGGGLDERVMNAGRFSEDEARYFFQQLLSGVNYCHFKQVCHGDLKLANTLLDGSPAPRVKICDFGHAVSYQPNSKPNSIASTLRYIAPEVLSGERYDGKLADVWSCGVTLYVMLFGAYPFEDKKDPENIEKTTQRILGARYKIPADFHISKECRNLLSRIFVPSRSRDITIQMIMNHPFCQRNLPREFAPTAQSRYYARDRPTFFLQSVETIMKIVEEAKKPAMNPSPVSRLTGRWGKEENRKNQEENIGHEVEEENKFEVDKEYKFDVTAENEYDTQMRTAERSLVLNQFYPDHTDPSPLASTSFDQSISGLRLAERSMNTNQLHSYYSDSAASQSVSYAEKATDSKLLDLSISAVRSAERSTGSNISQFYHSHPPASQSVNFAGNPTNSQLFDSSISGVRSSEKSINSNAPRASTPSAYHQQLDSKNRTNVTRSYPSMSDVRPAEKSIVLNQLHSHDYAASASKLHTEAVTEELIESKVLDSDYSVEIDAHSAKKCLIM